MPIVHVHNFSYGLLNPVLGYLMSCLGAFIGLRCVTRSRAYQGLHRSLWLLLAAVALGAAGIWAMHFIAMLGFTIPGQTILYNVPLTILSMLVSVAVVAIGLFIVGFSRNQGTVPLVAGGVIVGLGVASMHYLGMDAIVMPDMMKYSIPLVALSVVIAIVAGTAALWAALRVRGIWPTVAASLIMGVAVTGMHYTGMAAMHLYATTGGIYGAGQGVVTSGEGAGGFVLPLVLGIGIFSFLALIVIMLAPSEEEILADTRLSERLAEWPVSHRR
ncbi:MAG: MHYT domain-containing protein [Streptosporangiaceae bacterium]